MVEAEALGSCPAFSGEHWLEKELESGRIGYVANTRAKYSLVWAVPKLKTEEQA
ncbi:hypothetical protein MKY96_05275 [Paenibacillus sp. FSL R7-0302]|uniref:hypothetical protein n=1 Tax=Paenibacillus sp. FSL R7-0302 TaxID=2921681 RepID=UPI0030FC1C91